MARSKYNPKSLYFFIKDIIDTNGWKFSLFIATGYLGVVGSANYFIRVIQLPFWQEVGHDGTVQAEMAAIASSPWSLKGLIGIISDCFPIFGFYKTSYLFIYSIIGYVCLLCLAFIPLSFFSTNPFVGGMLFFGATLFAASYDLLMETKYIALMKQYPERKANLLSFAFSFTLLGQLIPAALVGVLTTVSGAQMLFIIFFVISLLPLIPLMIGGMINDRVEHSKNNKVDYYKLKENWKLVLLAVIQVILAILLIIIGQITVDSTFQLIYIIISIIFMGTLGFFILNNTAARLNLFGMIYALFYVNLQSGIEYFFTAEDECVTNGPKFSITFLRTIGTICLTLSQLVAVYVFQTFMQTWNLRFCYWFTLVLSIIASLTDLVLVKRWNEAIGISDEVFYVLGYSFFFEFTTIVHLLPSVVLLSKVSPKGVEATFFALMRGNVSYAASCSYYIGVFLYQIFGLETQSGLNQGADCNFESLPFIIIIGRVVLPAIAVGLVFVLIPNIKLFDVIDEKENLFKKKPKHNNENIQNEILA